MAVWKWITCLSVIAVAASQVMAHFGLDKEPSFFCLHIPPSVLLICYTVWQIGYPVTRFLSITNTCHGAIRSVGALVSTIKETQRTVDVLPDKLEQLRERVKEQLKQAAQNDPKGPSLPLMRMKADAELEHLREEADALVTELNGIASECLQWHSTEDAKLESAAKSLRWTLLLNVKDRIGEILTAYVLLNVAFGGLYYSLWGISSLNTTPSLSVPPGLSMSLSDFLYFSVVTATTVGYGDIHPVGWLPQLLVVVQIACATAFLVGFVGWFVGLIVSDDVLSLSLRDSELTNAGCDEIVANIQQRMDFEKTFQDDLDALIPRLDDFAIQFKGLAERFQQSPE